MPGEKGERGFEGFAGLDGNVGEEGEQGLNGLDGFPGKYNNFIFNFSGNSMYKNVLILLYFLNIKLMLHNL